MTGSNQNQVPEKIVGANVMSGELMFKLKWIDNDKMSWIKAEILNVEYPKLVIDFYQSKLVWDDFEERIDDK